jgi:hypothetical protein
MLTSQEKFALNAMQAPAEGKLDEQNAIGAVPRMEQRSLLKHVPSDDAEDVEARRRLTDGLLEAFDGIAACCHRLVVRADSKASAAIDVAVNVRVVRKRVIELVDQPNAAVAQRYAGVAVQDANTRHQVVWMADIIGRRPFEVSALRRGEGEIVIGDSADIPVLSNVSNTPIPMGIALTYGAGVVRRAVVADQDRKIAEPLGEK